MTANDVGHWQRMDAAAVATSPSTFISTEQPVYSVQSIMGGILLDQKVLVGIVLALGIVIGITLILVIDRYRTENREEFTCQKWGM